MKIKNQKLAKSVFCSLWFIASGAAMAGGVSGAKIGMAQPHSDGALYVYYDGGSWTKGPCAYPDGTKANAHYKIVGVGANEIYASALAAMAAGLTVEIVGTGVCDGGVETVSYMRVQKPGGF